MAQRIIRKNNLFCYFAIYKKEQFDYTSVEMDVEFENDDQYRLAFDPTFRGKWSWTVKQQYQEVIVIFKTLTRRESLFPMTGLNFKLFPGKMKGQKKKKYKKEYSVRLNGRDRVLLTFVGPKETEKIRIIFVGDYH